MMIRKNFLAVDWILLGATVPIFVAGLVTMNSFSGEGSLFGRQLAWISLGLLLFFILSFVDFRFLRRSRVSVGLFFLSVLALLFLFFGARAVKGSQSWFNLGFFSLQPSEPVKLVLIIILAKYFSRRHIEIARIRHILLSGFYALVLFALVLLQPDFGSAVILFMIWLGMALLSGISKKHLALVFFSGLVAAGGLWFYVFQDYQKQRIINFIHPLSDIRGTGYNAYQSTIAVGSGELFGKGVGFGTQSRLRFLPEYETDFVFAAFAEEWGFVGVIILFCFYAAIIWRILLHGSRGASNFEIFFGLGLAVFFTSHIFVNVGMNVGLLPVTGITLPFMSYGGTHLLTEFGGLGILIGMSRYGRPAHKDLTKNELPGI